MKMQWIRTWASNARQFLMSSSAGAQLAVPDGNLYHALPGVVPSPEPGRLRGKEAERRAFPRLQIQLAVNLTDGHAMQVGGSIVNLSNGGLAVRMPIALQLNQRVGVSFRFLGTESEFVAIGKVVWTDQRGSAGIQFVQIPKISHREALAHWLRYLGTFQPQPDEKPSGLLAWHGDWVPADTVDDPIIAHDTAFRILMLNRAAKERLGRTGEDVTGRMLHDILSGAPETWRGCPYCGTAAGEEVPDPCFGGVSVISHYPYANERGIVGTLHLVKSVTVARAAQVSNFHRLFEQVQEGAFVCTPEGRLLDCNRPLVLMLGFRSEAELMAANLNDLYVEKNTARELRTRLEMDGCIRDFEVPMRRADGTPIVLLQTSFAVRDSKGKISSYQGFVLDVTSRRLAEQQEQRRKRELYVLNAISQVADRSFDIAEIARNTLCYVSELVGADLGSVYLYHEQRSTLTRLVNMGYDAAAELPEQIPLNPQLLMSLSESGVQVLGKQHHLCVPAAATDALQASGARYWRWGVLWGRGKVLGVLEIGKRSSHDFENQYEVLLQSICHQFALAIEQVRLYREVSDAYENLRLAQEQLLQTEKMASVGQLTAGVAHELNNPLTALLGYISLIKGLEISDDARGLVDKLHVQTKRMHNIIQNLLSFSRQQKPRKDPVSILRVLESTLALREYEMRAKNIRIESEVEFPLPMVMADANQLEQVFLNIVNNAIDAMLGQKGQGTLKINVAFLENHLSVKFHDSGPGLSDLKRIFDPFYTTKPVGKGTGLGLSICDGLVKEHGGEIIPRNPPEGGAEFSINLPVVMNPAIRCERRIKQSIGGRRKLTGRVLVLDPDPVCKAFLAETLTAAGFRVVMPRDGEDAIKLLSQEIPDALVLEATGSRPPEGMDVYLWVQQNRPELAGRVVMTVGSCADGKVRRFVQDHSLVYVAKPFEMLDLLEKLQAVMERQKYKTAAISCSA